MFGVIPVAAWLFVIFPPVKGFMYKHCSRIREMSVVSCVATLGKFQLLIEWSDKVGVCYKLLVRIRDG